MLETTNKVLTSAWSDTIQELLQNRIRRSLMFESQDRTVKLFSLMYDRLRHSMERNFDRFRISNKSNSIPWHEYCRGLWMTRSVHVRSMSIVRIISTYTKHNIIILDKDKETIVDISSTENYGGSIKLIYNPSCDAYPEGYYDAYVDSQVVTVSSEKQNEWVMAWLSKFDDDHNLLFSAITVAFYRIHGDIRGYGTLSVVQRLFTAEEYVYQVKRGRALLRLDMNHPTRPMNQCEYVEFDSSHLASCIEQALKSENASQLAKFLEEFESESRSAVANSPEHETEMVTSSVPRDACKLFLSSGSSNEAEVYRQLVVKKINDGDITTALKLCCIGHQILFCRDNLQISDSQTLRDTFKLLLKMELYKSERSKFLSICEEWYRALEPRGLMNIEQRELLREWISTRQYANTEDPVVSLVLEECSKPKKEEEERTMKKGEDEDEEKQTMEKVLRDNDVDNIDREYEYTKLDYVDDDNNDDNDDDEIEWYDAVADL